MAKLQWQKPYLLLQLTLAIHRFTGPIVFYVFVLFFSGGGPHLAIPLCLGIIPGDGQRIIWNVGGVKPAWLPARKGPNLLPICIFCTFVLKDLRPYLAVLRGYFQLCGPGNS